MSDPKAVKTVVTVTVYSPGPLGHLDIVDIVEQAESGDFIMGFVTGVPEFVEGDTLRGELIAIGNDGTFFDGDDGE